MNLTKRESEMIRQVAFYKNVFKEQIESKLDHILHSIPEKKHVLALGYFQFLTNNDGRKSFVVDFEASGMGHLTFHGCTASEAREKALYKLQNGAFGVSVEWKDITIQCISPETLHHNSYEEYLKSVAELPQLA